MNLVAQLRVPPKLQARNRVAIMSPSWAGAAVVPDVDEIDVNVLRNKLGLVSVEYPTTRRVNASPEERAGDLNADFANPDVAVIMTVIASERMQPRVVDSSVTVQGQVASTSPESLQGQDPLAIVHQRRDCASAMSAHPWVRP